MKELIESYKEIIDVINADIAKRYLEGHDDDPRDETIHRIMIELYQVAGLIEIFLEDFCE